MGKYNGLRLLIALAWISLFLSTGNLHKQFSTYTYHSQDATPGQLSSPSNNQDENNNLDPQTTPKPVTTLVHFDPYFMGGFRNQHMRFVAFVSFAVQHNISQILLPSIQWADPYKKLSVHHELLFDVPYWNSRAGSMGLPMFVNYDPDVLEGVFPNNNNNNSDVMGNNSSGGLVDPAIIPCWNETSGLYSGLDEAIYRHPNTNLRRMNTWSEISQKRPYLHCRRTPGPEGENSHEQIAEEAARETNSTNVHRFTHLMPHGGQHGSGRLWFEYKNLQSNRGGASETVTINNQTVQIHPEHVYVERAIYDLLRPSREIRLAIKTAIDGATKNSTSFVKNKPPRLMALHPRVEQDMIGHKCSKHMEKSLKQVFERLQMCEPLHDDIGNFRFDLVFIAINKEEIEKETGRQRGSELDQLINDNRETLHRARKSGLFSSGVSIFESGMDSAAGLKFRYLQAKNNSGNYEEESTVVSAQSLGVVSLAGSIINFFTAVEAESFVGVKGSTYSTDVFSVRYYQHKHEAGGGAENYIVGPEGIRRLYGPAAPHDC